MATNLAIHEKLLTEAKRLTGLRTKRDTLRDFVRSAKLLGVSLYLPVAN